MKIKLLFLLMLLYNFSYAEKWNEYGEHRIDSKIIVIKLNKNSAPLLGIEDALNIQSGFSFIERLKDDGAISMRPLFLDFRNFSTQHYEIS